MDIRLFARVLSRFRYLVAAGFLVAVLLSVLTVAKLPSLAPRTPPKYASTATLLVTQHGFPWGSAVQQFTNSKDAGGAPVTVGDLGRLTALANLYVQLANSDVIRTRVVRMSPVLGTVSATQNYAISPQLYSTALPMLTISGISDSPAHAITVTETGVNALKGYIEQQQQAASIDKQERVVVQVVQHPREASVINPIKKTLPVVVFLTVMLAVSGLAFALENLRPRAPLVGIPRAKTEPLSDRARRSA
jgi:hypothetical protein